MRRAVPEVAPDLVLVTNIFRDQLDRFGELYDGANAGGLYRGAAPARQRGPQRRRPARGEPRPAGPARRLYFGLRLEGVGTQIPEHSADTIRCVHCQHDLTYRRVYLSHLGDYECPRMREQAAAPGHRGHPGRGVAGRGLAR